MLSKSINQVCMYNLIKKYNFSKKNTLLLLLFCLSHFLLTNFLLTSLFPAKNSLSGSKSNFKHPLVRIKEVNEGEKLKGGRKRKMV